MARALARSTGIGKGVAKGMAGFLDFKRVFEDATRKQKWQRERDELESREKRQNTAFQAGYRPAEGQMGQWLAGGNVPMERPQTINIPGIIQLPDGSYRNDPNFQGPQSITLNQALNVFSDPVKIRQL